MNEQYETLKRILLERFGTPIGERPTLYGVPDEREGLTEKEEEED
jgi:hypothetical protein